MKKKRERSALPAEKPSGAAAARVLGWSLAAWLAVIGWKYYHSHDQVALWQMWRYWPTLIPQFSEARAWVILRDLGLLAELLWLVLLGRGAGAALLARAGLATGEKPGQFALSLAAGWGAMAREQARSVRAAGRGNGRPGCG